MGVKYGGLFEPWELAIVRRLIKEFKLHWWSIAYDPEDDLMQDCLLHWLYVRRESDPRRRSTRSAFMTRVIRNKLTDLVRERESERRKADYHARSLDEPLGSEHWSPTLLDLLDAQLMMQSESAADIRGNEVRMDLARALSHLTPLQRRLCCLLGPQGCTVREASHRLHRSRKSVYEELKRIRKVFEDLGFEGYLKV